MPALFRNTETPFPAELICIRLLLFQVVLSLMQFVTVDVRYSICDDVTVQVVFVLVDTDQALEAVKEFANKLPADFKTLGCRDLFIFVEADNVVGIHSARVFSPLLLLVQETLIHAVFVYFVRLVGACDIDITFLHLVAAEDVCYDGDHCAVAFCRAIDDLIDCHISSLSFLYPLICREILSSSLMPGA